jgi:hypothetical protein
MRGRGQDPPWPINRLSFRDGETVAAGGFTDEQSFHLGESQWREALRRTAGVSEGLGVTLPDTGTRRVVVWPGTAFDLDGRQIVLAPSDAPGPPLGPGIAGAAGADRSAWLPYAGGARAGLSGWARTFTAAECGGSTTLDLYVAFGEASLAPAKTGDPSTDTRWQQQPIIDIVDGRAGVPDGALVLAVLTVGSSGFTQVAYWSDLVARTWSGLWLPAPAQAQADSDKALFYLRAAPFGPATPEQLQIAGAGALALGALASGGSGGIDPQQPSLTIQPSGDAIIAADRVRLTGPQLAIGDLVVGPAQRPLLSAGVTSGAVQVTGGFTAGGGGVSWLDVEAAQISVNAPLTCTNPAGTTWSSTAAAPAGLTLGVPLQLLGGALYPGDPGDSIDSIAPVSGVLTIAAQSGVVLGVVANAALQPLLAIAPAHAGGAPGAPIPAAVSLAVPVTLAGAHALTCQGAMSIAGPLTVPATSGAIASPMWNVQALAATLNQWTRSGRTSVATTSFTSSGGAVMLSISGMLPAAAVPLAQTADFTITVESATATVPALSLLMSPAFPGYGAWQVPLVNLLVECGAGTHTVQLALAQPVASAGAALTGTVLEQPVARPAV